MNKMKITNDKKNSEAEKYNASIKKIKHLKN